MLIEEIAIDLLNNDITLNDLDYAISNGNITESVAKAAYIHSRELVFDAFINKEITEGDIYDLIDRGIITEEDVDEFIDAEASLIDGKNSVDQLKKTLKKLKKKVDKKDKNGNNKDCDDKDCDDNKDCDDDYSDGE